MRRIVFAALAAVYLTGAASTESAAVERVATPGQDSSSATLQGFGPARPPFGYVSFCNRYPRECAQYTDRNASVELTAQRWRELVEINDLINALVEPVTDEELYKTVEFWTFPTGRGDCEDYVLAKRRLLAQYGWPAGALRITVVRDEENLGHAVLTVVTDKGDLVLDNKTGEIRYWRDTPYVFKKRQSATDPLVWESLNARDELRDVINDPVAAR